MNYIFKELKKELYLDIQKSLIASLLISMFGPKTIVHFSLVFLYILF